MTDVPTGCQERYAFILQTAAELAVQFDNGNRKHVLETLEALPLRVALAVVARMQAPWRSRPLALFLTENA